MKLHATIWFFTLCAVFYAGKSSMPQSGEKTELHVFAAASLSEAFRALGKTFERQHPGVEIQFNFGGSQQLVQQIVQGADADVLASANMKQMGIAVKSGVMDSSLPRIFARNRLVVILPKTNPGRLATLNDLAKPGVKLVLADSSVPAGQYALQIFDRCSAMKEFGDSFRTNVMKNVVSYEENVLAVLSKVKLDECDAGIVYTSDISRDSTLEVMRIYIPDDLNIIAEYPIAIVKESKARSLAASFIEYVISDEGGRTLSDFGFMRVNQSEKR
jgi:molybdate transport system substrate-binding protein